MLSAGRQQIFRSRLDATRNGGMKMARATYERHVTDKVVLDEKVLSSSVQSARRNHFAPVLRL